MLARLLFFLQTDCPTCQMAVPYLNLLAEGGPAEGVSQDSAEATAAFIAAFDARFEMKLDDGLELSRKYDPAAVPAVLWLDEAGAVKQSLTGFDKDEWNALGYALGVGQIADEYDGRPRSKPGCMSRHRETPTEGESAAHLTLHERRGAGASRIAVATEDDVFELAFERFGDALPVIPPTVERVERMLGGRDPLEVVARIAPNYGAATMEKIAANAVMAGCRPELMRVLIPLIRAVADERFNIHGVQATTHFAAPLVIVNGPVRAELGFASGQNVFSNVARANSTLGRALQLILVNVGGASPTGIDMSALGNPGKFASCIAENEEANPWEPLHAGSAVTLLAAEPPRGVSEHNSRTARGVLRAVSYALATIWSYRQCLTFEALVVLCPEHVKTIHRDGWTKQRIREFLFENTGVPLRCYDGDGGEGEAMRNAYSEVTIDGEPCYQKFRSPDQIHIVVAGGAAGKFSAVIGSWASGPRGSQMVTYKVESE